MKRRLRQSRVFLASSHCIKFRCWIVGMRRRNLTIVVFGLMMLMRSIVAGQSHAGPLQVGDAFPSFVATTLTGRSVTLPSNIIKCRPMILIFSFSRKAAGDARLWDRRVHAGLSGREFPVYAVIELQTVPKIFRGMAVSGIRSSTSVSVQERTIVLYRDDQLWKRRLGVSDMDRAYVVLIGSRGHLRWANSGSFTDREYADLSRAISRRP